LLDSPQKATSSSSEEGKKGDLEQAPLNITPDESEQAKVKAQEIFRGDMRPSEVGPYLGKT